MIAAARALRAPFARVPELPGAAYLLALLAAGFALASPEFLSARNLSNIALQCAALIIVSLGMTLVILTEGIDLSLGAVLGLVRRGDEHDPGYTRFPPGGAGRGAGA